MSLPVPSAYTKAPNQWTSRISKVRHPKGGFRRGRHRCAPCRASGQNRGGVGRVDPRLWQRPGVHHLALFNKRSGDPGWLFLREQKRRAPFQTPRIEPIPPPTPLTNQPVMGPSAPNHAVIAVTPKNLTFVSGAAGESVTHEVKVENMVMAFFPERPNLLGPIVLSKLFPV